jgi:SAM-dependent methyltransferase
MSGALCSALPLRTGDTVAVIGWPPNVAVAARGFGVTTIVVAETSGEHAEDPDARPSPASARLPLEDSSVDHVMLKAGTPRTRNVVPRELARIVRPGGTVLVLARSGWIRTRGRSHAPRRWTGKDLRSAGLTDVRSYGVRPGPTLDEARYLVPFDCPSALRWYVRSFISTASFRSSFASSAMRIVPGSHALLGRFPAVMLRALFPAVALRASRPGRGTPQ